MLVSPSDYRAEQDIARTLVPSALLFPPGLPDGYSTVWGFLFDHEPWVLTTMGDPVAGLRKDDCRARREAMAMCEPSVSVSDPEVLRGHRATLIGAFSRATLERVFPV